MDVASGPLPHRLTATDAAARIRAGTLDCETLLRSCLAHIDHRDPQVRAWVRLDAATSLRRARERDNAEPSGPLHGIPIGIKDVIDAEGMPTGHNSPQMQDRRPAHDAACVATLRAAGAVILGKTDTTEFAAAGRHALTRNPADVSRSPGGSSSGSAAAVADCQVPLAIGTQTGGSLIRPASFCGVQAFKPSWGVVSREGAKQYSPSFDTVGWYGRSVADLTLLAEVFAIEDDTPPGAADLRGRRIAVARPFPQLTGADSSAAVAHAAACARGAGAEICDLVLPDAFATLNECHKTILFSEGRAAFLDLYRADFAGLHDDFRHRVENRERFTRADLRAAYDLAARCREQFDALASGYDAVLAPSAPSVAPLGRDPGDPRLNQIWTLLHTPCVNLAGCVGAHGLPVGVTLTGPRFTDRRVLTVAAVLEQLI